MTKFITIFADFTVREVIDAIDSAGLIVAPRDDIQVGDVLTDYEKMLCNLIPWDDTLVPAQPE